MTIFSYQYNQPKGKQEYLVPMIKLGINLHGPHPEQGRKQGDLFYLSTMLLKENRSAQKDNSTARFSYRGRDLEALVVFKGRRNNR